MNSNQPSTPSNAESAIASESLGSKIRRLRLDKGIGQERLAIEANVDQSGLSKFERGKEKRMIGEQALRRLAAVLEVQFEELISGTDYLPVSR
jgi:transcriptional regulator with XRE-family HTH domain